MALVYILLLIEGITGQMVLYQQQNIVSVDGNGTAVITCVSSEELENGIKISWYHKKWKSTEDPIRVKSCSTDNDTHKYVCKNKKHVASLEIYNVQTNDSGVYYCGYLFSDTSRKFGNGTNLIVGDRSTSRTSVHILGHLQPRDPHSFLHLVCVVLASHKIIHLYWNISGTYYKGRIISKEESDGTWTIINFISLLKNNGNYVEKLTCEAWFNTSSFSVHWNILEKDELSENVTSKCQSFLIPVLTAGTLLMVTLFLHLRRTLNLTENKTPKKPVTENEIFYAELNKNHLTTLKKQPRK